MKCGPFLSERESIVLQWAFKLNSALVTVDLKDCMLKVGVGTLGCYLPSVFLSLLELTLETGLQALIACSGYNYSVWPWYIPHRPMTMETISELVGIRSVFIWLITR